MSSKQPTLETFGDDLSLPELRPITSDDLKHEKPSTSRPPLDAPKIQKRIPQTHPHHHPGVRTMILNPVKMSPIEIVQMAQLPVATDINTTNAKFRNKIHGHHYTKSPSPSSRMSLAVSLPMVAIGSADNSLFEASGSFIVEDIVKLPSQSSLHPHDHPHTQETDPNQRLEMNDDAMDHQDMIGQVGEGYKGGLDDQDDHQDLQSIGSAVTATSIGGALEDSLVNKLLMRKNNHGNSMVLNDSMRSRKSLSTVINNNSNSNSTIFNDSGKVSRKSTPSNNIIATTSNSNSNNANSNNAHSHHHALDSSSGHVRAFESMLSDLQIFPSDVPTEVSVHKRIPGWKLTRGSDRREALMQSLLAATVGGGGSGDVSGRSSRPATTTHPANNDRIIAPGRLLGVGVGVETLPLRAQSQLPSRSQYNSRASPPPSPPRSIGNNGVLVRAPYAGHPMAGIPLVASNALVIGQPTGLPMFHRSSHPSHHSNSHPTTNGNNLRKSKVTDATTTAAVNNVVGVVASEVDGDRGGGDGIPDQTESSNNDNNNNSNNDNNNNDDNNNSNNDNSSNNNNNNKNSNNNNDESSVGGTSVTSRAQSQSQPPSQPSQSQPMTQSPTQQKLFAMSMSDSVISTSVGSSQPLQQEQGLGLGPGLELGLSTPPPTMMVDGSGDQSHQNFTNPSQHFGITTIVNHNHSYSQHHPHQPPGTHYPVTLQRRQAESYLKAVSRAQTAGEHGEYGRAKKILRQQEEDKKAMMRVMQGLGQVSRPGLGPAVGVTQRSGTGLGLAPSNTAPTSSSALSSLLSPLFVAPTTTIINENHNTQDGFRGSPISKNYAISRHPAYLDKNLTHTRLEMVGHTSYGGPLKPALPGVMTATVEVPVGEHIRSVSPSRLKALDRLRYNHELALATARTASTDIAKNDIDNAFEQTEEGEKEGENKTNLSSLMWSPNDHNHNQVLPDTHSNIGYMDHNHHAHDNDDNNHHHNLHQNPTTTTFIDIDDSNKEDHHSHPDLPLDTYPDNQTAVTTMNDSGFPSSVVSVASFEPFQQHQQQHQEQQHQEQSSPPSPLADDFGPAQRLDAAPGQGLDRHHSPARMHPTNPSPTTPTAPTSNAPSSSSSNKMLSRHPHGMLLGSMMVITSPTGKKPHSANYYDPHGQHSQQKDRRLGQGQGKSIKNMPKPLPYYPPGAYLPITGSGPGLGSVGSGDGSEMGLSPTMMVKRIVNPKDKNQYTGGITPPIISSTRATSVGTMMMSRQSLLSRSTDLVLMARSHQFQSAGSQTMSSLVNNASQEIKDGHVGGSRGNGGHGGGKERTDTEMMEFDDDRSYHSDHSFSNLEPPVSPHSPTIDDYADMTKKSSITSIEGVRPISAPDEHPPINVKHKNEKTIRKMVSDATNTEVDLQTAMMTGLESIEPPPPKNVTFYNSTINLGPARITAKNILRKGYAPYPHHLLTGPPSITTITGGGTKKIKLVDLVLGELSEKGW